MLQVNSYNYFKIKRNISVSGYLMNRNEGVVLAHALYLFVFTFIFNTVLYFSLYLCTSVHETTKRLLHGHFEIDFLLSKV